MFRATHNGQWGHLASGGRDASTEAFDARMARLPLGLAKSALLECSFDGVECRAHGRPIVAEHGCVGTG